LLQAAGSLAFTTLLSIVPLAAVSFALFSRFPSLFGRFEAALERYLLAAMLPPEIARTVLRHVDRFAASAPSLGLAGIALLLLAALAMLLTVDNTLNRFWGVRSGRPFARRLGLYLALLALAPPLLGITLWALSLLIGASMGWIGPLPPWAAAVLQSGPLLMTTVALAALYRFVPHTRVGWGAAVLGGVLAGVALELGKRGFAAWLVKMPTYQALYGALAVLPLFMLWVWFSWLVVLGAALVAAQWRGAGARRSAA
jgi:membrane protein